MSLKPARPRSIASQLALFFTIAAALLLSCGLSIFYLMVVRHAFEEDNSVLRDKVYGLRATLKNHGPVVLSSELTTTQRDLGYLVRLLDGNGRVLAETPGMSSSVPAAAFSTPAPASVALVPKDFRTGRKLFSLAATREPTPVGSFVLQVAQDRSGDEQFTREFGILLLGLLLLGVICSLVLGVSLTRRGLRPISEMVHAVAHIDPAHLSERVAPARWPQELQPLATAFDEMLARLEDSFTRLSQFSADLAHELRTPIANIRGEAEVALTRPRDNKEYREVIESTVAECQRLSGIVENLLFLARAEAADRQIERTTFNGRLALEKLAGYYRTAAEERHITILCTGQADVVADSMLFNHAISNLIDNAMRFTADGGTISLAVAEKNSQQVEVSVSDNGSGIPQEHLPRVFDRFYRLDSSRSSGGVGLGLALVKSIAQLHGGSARIQSELGRGTTVTIIFPKRQAVERPVA